MSKGAYTYEPGNITEFGKDRMRFELGDTMVEGLADTTALTDEEIQAAIDAYPNKWKRAKLNYDGSNLSRYKIKRWQEEAVQIDWRHFKSVENLYKNFIKFGYYE